MRYRRRPPRGWLLRAFVTTIRRNKKASTRLAFLLR
jgi:hypothetical protein